MGTPASPVLGDRASLNIFKVEYRAARGRRRKVTHWVKTPYGGLFGLTEALTRAVSQGTILWFRVLVTSAITREIRDQLQRWPEALADGEVRFNV
jgi:hypothetical protein